MPWLVRISVLLHAAALIVLIVKPQLWLDMLALLFANHAVITFTGLWPRSTWLGSNWTRLPAPCAARRQIALTIDDGPDPEITPQVLDLLDRHGVKATFFCIGEKAIRYPDLCRQIIQQGHAVENHSQHHRHYFSLLGMSGLDAEIQAAQRTLTEVTGRRPRFFRAPAGLRNPFLDPVLTRHGLQLAAWTRRGYDTRTTDAATVLRRLQQGLRPGAILLLHDGNCARASDGQPVIVKVLPALIESARSAGLQFTTLTTALKITQYDCQVH